MSVDTAPAPKKKKVVAPPKPVAPPPKPDHIRVKDCKTGVLYCDKAPLAPRAAILGKWDLEAVWVHVVEQPTAEKFNLMVHFHGNDNHVKVDQDGKTVDPDWRKFAKGFVNAPVASKFAESATLFQQPLVLIPEDVNTTNFHTTEIGTILGSGLGDFVDDALRLLSTVSTHFLCQEIKGPTTNFLNSKPALNSITRFFLTGHSGGGKPLAAACLTDLALGVKNIDLWLYDCTYGWGAKEYPQFCDKLRAKLGNGPNKSRLVSITTPGSTTNNMKDIVRDIRAKGIAVNDELDYTDPKKKDLLKKGPDAPSSDAAHMEQVLRCNPVVWIRVPAVHRSGEAWHGHIPGDFMPILLKTAAQACS